MTTSDLHGLPTPILLFVYGTLRPGLASAAAHALVHDLERAGAATMRGAMLRGDGVVHGELLCVHDAARLRALDAYEECGGPAPLFERIEGIARRADGVHVAAAAYLYVGPLGDGAIIPGGDYAVVARVRRPAS
ncbi:MAG: gamma-glutamylcyclotransferase [Planctomycetia bacterium]|nr:gamma-glutamylcyclotransferase [Planctomycetia bacterium]